MKKDLITKSLRLRIDVVEKVQKCADAENRSFNNMVEVLLKRYIKQNEAIASPTKDTTGNTTEL